MTCAEVAMDDDQAGRYQFFCEYWFSFSLDDKTAQKLLWISEGGSKVARTSDAVCPYPNRPERYDHSPQVLCKEGLLGHRGYWEVDYDGWVVIGVVCESAPRKAQDGACGLGRTAPPGAPAGPAPATRCGTTARTWTPSCPRPPPWASTWTSRRASSSSCWWRARGREGGAADPQVQGQHPGEGAARGLGRYELLLSPPEEGSVIIITPSTCWGL
ncbi:hypothetical protein INR49_030406 [Caranx melampygus]|nr:hypothetical protein INR49_030406 [Caranx melampygus]